VAHRGLEDLDGARQRPDLVVPVPVGYRQVAVTRGDAFDRAGDFRQRRAIARQITSTPMPTSTKAAAERRSRTRR